MFRKFSRAAQAERESGHRKPHNFFASGVLVATQRNPAFRTRFIRERSKPNDSAPRRDCYGFRAILCSYLVEDVPQVHFDGLLGNTQPLSDIAVPVPRGYKG